jgi:hypothetical protein
MQSDGAILTTKAISFKSSLKYRCTVSSNVLYTHSQHSSKVHIRPKRLADLKKNLKKTRFYLSVKFSFVVTGKA